MGCGNSKGKMPKRPVLTATTKSTTVTVKSDGVNIKPPNAAKITLPTFGDTPSVPSAVSVSVPSHVVKPSKDDPVQVVKDGEVTVSISPRPTAPAASNAAPSVDKKEDSEEAVAPPQRLKRSMSVIMYKEGSSPAMLERKQSTPVIYQYSFFETTPHVWLMDPASEAAKVIASHYVWYNRRFSPPIDSNYSNYFDVASVTENPRLAKVIVEAFMCRYKTMHPDYQPTHICAIDTGGFLLAAPLAYRYSAPLVLIRREDKAAGAIIETAANDHQTLCVREGALPPNSRVVFINDVLGNGDTAIAALNLAAAANVNVIEFAVVVAIKSLDGARKIHEYDDGKFRTVNLVSMIIDSNIVSDPETCGDPKELIGDSRVRNIL